MGVIATPVLGAAVVGFAAAGAVAGAGARVVLLRLRRGTRVGAPVCELAVGSAWAAAGGMWAAGLLPGRWLPALLALGWFGVAVGLVDLRHHRLPDALTLPALPAALLLLAPLGAPALGRAAAGAAVAVAVHAAVHLAAPSSLGAGDVKLAAPLGAVLAAVSWPALVAAALLASVTTAAVALATGRPVVPHGPSMVLATVVVVAAAAGLGGSG